MKLISLLWFDQRSSFDRVHGIQKETIESFRDTIPGQLFDNEYTPSRVRKIYNITVPDWVSGKKPHSQILNRFAVGCIIGYLSYADIGKYFLPDRVQDVQIHLYFRMYDRNLIRKQIFNRNIL
jgi:hypothetical protein